MPLSAHDREAGPLAWIARNSAKPGRPASECWVAHATTAWTEAHLEGDRDDVASMLTEAFRSHAGTLPAIRHAAAHRWRYATTHTPLGQPFLTADGLHIGGDWCLGARVEHGFESGRAIGQDLAARLA